MIQRAWLLGLMCTSFAITGCGDDDGGGGPAIEEIPALYADAICDAYMRCLGPGTPKYLTPETCLDINLANIEDSDFQFLQDAVDAGRVQYRSDRVNACIAALGTIACDELGSHPPEACRDALAGTIDEGEDCALDEECSGNAFCDTTGMACPGTCTALGAAGSDCEENEQCDTGLVCACTGSPVCNGTCTTQVGVGDTCGGSAADCALGLFCAGENADMNISGECKTIDEVFVGAVGDECSLDDGLLCEDGVSCAATVTGSGATLMVAWECEAEVAEDADCKLAIPDQCPVGQFCDVNPGGLAPRFVGTCKDLPRAGQDCSDWQNLCAAGSVCDVAGLCQPVNRIGGVCNANNQCASDHCVGGECAAPTLCDLEG